MKKRKNFAVYGVCALTAAFLLAGCSSSEAPEESTQAPAQTSREAEGGTTAETEAVAAERFDWPQVNTAKMMGSLGFVDNSIEASIRNAVFDLTKRVEMEFGMPFMDAYMLIGQCVNVEICQMLGNACAAFASIDRELFL